MVSERSFDYALAIHRGDRHPTLEWKIYLTEKRSNKFSIPV
jgi:hypothetical protein